MKKISVVLIGIIAITIGILSIPKENKQVLIEEELNNENTSLAFYIERENGNYEESSSLPGTGYVLDTEKSICTNNTTPVWSDNKLYLDNLQNRGTSCYLYFKKLCPPGATACETILSDLTISDERNGEITGPLSENTTGTIYRVPDDWGNSYAYAGQVDNNWIYFAGYYWRIIRINGDGSIRMIYNGTTTDQTGGGTQIGTSAYNTNYNDNAYVGYMYGTAGSSTYEATHANTNDSTIKQTLDNWYQTNIADKNYGQYISTEQGFCNDRQTMSGVDSSYGIAGYGTNATSYASWGRLYQNGIWLGSQNPSLKCSGSNDYFTISGSSRGNHKLMYPVGLITMDELVLAGGFGGSSNSNFYLYTNQYYWSMSPSNFNSTDSSASVFSMWANGLIDDSYAYGTWGIRPVINLKSNLMITGTGTTSDPYKVEGA